MKSKLWRVKAAEANVLGKLEEGAPTLEVSPLVSSVLNARCTSRGEAEELLSDASTIYSPYLFHSMEKAVGRIRAAIENEEMIAVYGDYDCDGTAATAILYDYLQNVGAKACYYIPSREKEGYGLNCPAVNALKELDTKLIITVDNGISAIEEIAYANSLGIDTIVTDHHTPKSELPPAFCNINPHIADCGYPFADLSGAGVAFKLVCALEDDLGYELIEQYGDLLAIATIGDIVSLLNENRYFVKKGLTLLQSGSRVGIKALFQTAGTDLTTPLTAETVAFALCPRITAAGRMETADYAVMLMLTEDEDEGAALAKKLNELNTIRKNEEKNIVDDISDMLDSDPEILDYKIPVLYKAEWNTGIVGIVASRLSERLQRPAIIIGGEGENAKGSGRSVPNFSLIEAVVECSAPLKYFGGHPMAAGFSIDAKDIHYFRKLLQEYEKKHPVPKVYLDVD
ncbi:MAG: single-stranded-DNA-specific exonuclease RecJ, partial [Oscillospiraceae bacterium]